ncbi:MAG: hypothetical protein AAF705_11825 [Bacteroidota bacterium]
MSYQIFIQLAVIFLVNLSAANGQHSLYIHHEKGHFAEFKNDRFVEALDDIFQEISNAQNVEKGYMYLHRSKVRKADSHAPILHVEVGWRNDNPASVIDHSNDKHLFFHLGGYAVLANTESIKNIEYTIIEPAYFTDQQLDDLIHEDEELIGIDAKGDTILYNPSWRP